MHRLNLVFSVHRWIQFQLRHHLHRHSCTLERGLFAAGQNVRAHDGLGHNLFEHWFLFFFHHFVKLHDQGRKQVAQDDAQNDVACEEIKDNARIPQGPMLV
jgi:hypothetical protein